MSHPQVKRIWNHCHTFRISPYRCINTEVQSVFRTRHLCQFLLLLQFVAQPGEHISSSHETVTSINVPSFPTHEIQFNLDLSIALPKNKQSCTSHLLYNFLPHPHLSPSFHIFVSYVLTLPKSLSEAMSHQVGKRLLKKK